jgi:hypothetical protein
MSASVQLQADRTTQTLETVCGSGHRDASLWLPLGASNGHTAGKSKAMRAARVAKVLSRRAILPWLPSLGAGGRQRLTWKAGQLVLG